MFEQIAAILRAEDGATVIEYALIAAIVSLSVIVLEGTIGTKLNNYFVNFATYF